MDTALKEPRLKLYTIFAGLFGVILVLSATTSVKIFAIGPFTLPGGVIFFPLVFIFNDILTEVYGYALSRRIIWTGLFCYILAGVTYLIVQALPPASFWPHQEAYTQILGFAPRIMFGGLIAYFCGEFANSYILSKMKFKQGGLRGIKQGWRFVASTMVGEGVDSFIIMIIAFYGVIPLSALFTTMATLYVVKVVYEIIALPFSTRLANWVKRVEGIDVIDTPETTNYSPFKSITS
mgnify:CR=1 FL=1